jgi:ABC-type transport system involved in multi-copper enzyme maturation permease subunit
MLHTVVWRELRGIVASPKFVTTFAVCSLLILLSIVIGIREYNAGLSEYEAALRLTDQAIRTQGSWMGLTTNVYRRPDPLQILITGVANDVGRTSAIGRMTGVKLKNSPYEDDPIFALFRSIDFVFVVNVVLSLFAILFTFDGMNGEREGGTLQLTFANAIPRGTFILGKMLGSWLGLVIPLAIPVTLGLLLLVVNGIPLTADHWERIALFLIVSLLYVSFFIVFGIMVSTLTRRSSSAFLIALVAWVAFVFVIPRLGVMAASGLRAVPSVAEVEAERDTYAKDRWSAHQDVLGERWKERQEGMSAMTKDQREAYRHQHLDAWMREDDELRKQVQREIDDYGLRLDEDLHNRTDDQQQLAFELTRFSPSSAFQLASMGLAGTGVSMKERYEDAMRKYREEFVRYIERKSKEAGNTGGFRITFDTDSGFKFSVPRERGTLDLSSLPAFIPPQVTLSQAAHGLIVDTGVIVFFSILAFGIACGAFFHYDLR